jgi:hypothetical protein
MHADQVLQLCDEVMREPELARALGLDRELVGAWRAALGRPPALRTQALREARERIDRVYVRVAGEAGAEPVETSPLWFTRLLKPPPALSWGQVEAEGTWQVHVWTAAGDILDRRVTSPEVALPREQVPTGANVRWEVLALSEADGARPLVRGVFKVLPNAEAYQVLERLRQLGDGRLPGQAEIRRAACFLKAGLFDPLVRHWTSAAAGPDPTQAFAAERGLATAYAEVFSELTRLRLGEPEGLWAAALAEEHADKALELLGGP